MHCITGWKMDGWMHARIFKSIIFIYLHITIANWPIRIGIGELWYTYCIWCLWCLLVISYSVTVLSILLIFSQVFCLPWTPRVICISVFKYLGMYRFAILKWQKIPTLWLEPKEPVQFLTHEEVQRVLLVLLDHTAHEELAPEEPGWHEGAILCHTDLVRTKLHPVCKPKHKQHKHTLQKRWGLESLREFHCYKTHVLLNWNGHFHMSMEGGIKFPENAAYSII